MNTNYQGNCVSNGFYPKKRDNKKILIREFINHSTGFWDIWETYEKLLFNYCFYNLTDKNYHDAEDLCRDTLVKAYEKIEIINPDTPVKGWLFRVARNTFYDQIRKNRVKEKYCKNELFIESTSQDALYQQVLNERLMKFIMKALSDVSKINDMIAMDYFINDKGYSQISSEYSISEAYARKVICRFRKKMKSNIPKQPASSGCLGMN
ncbi:RNA polymerase sigma factor [Vibrio quintilis]|uniref:RNA polymerase sigma factor SigM n=1 Tax=Vibrio quintilis TaxID=1117707 RepID=A0A1M7Z1R8_9VIBR|nr:sigma-70 family RNA polymerase sigma factor [Vibrio quintilis]SHO58909.1 RNA polymerase sigma factor SigM [Vibrio quintilis]